MLIFVSKREVDALKMRNVGIARRKAFPQAEIMFIGGIPLIRHRIPKYSVYISRF